MSAPLLSKLCRESARCAVKRMQAHVTRQHFVGISRFPASGSHCVSDIDYFLLLMLKTKGVSKMQRLFSARSAEFADRQEKIIFDRGRVVLFTSVEMLSRVLIFLFGLIVLSLGIATVTHAGLGTRYCEFRCYCSESPNRTFHGLVCVSHERFLFCASVSG